MSIILVLSYSLL